MVVLAVATVTNAFVALPSTHHVLPIAGGLCRTPRAAARGVSMKVEDLNLTPELAKLTRQFGMVPDAKLRYQQLLFFAAKLKTMDKELQVEENQVKGCQSVVYVHAIKDEEGNINYTGESDSALTKGLCALLVRGLSGNTVDEITAVDPEFIKEAGLAVSLTPSRNNGFLNMLNMMKNQALALK
eukprot:CAMPEP_0173080268 /NCGR_PEP_ID=MMETSP1102-20130122/16141_1 /TAXON_ID=49646 /ORGANISM="Geminigera sp., Strain Caron Lab Isolate" /LENGTH=183 /DNA_ID=CAMNT_0013953755 /DNA_START=21 /DNA_END=572 /DNA_ORIENTATION=-